MKWLSVHCMAATSANDTVSFTSAVRLSLSDDFNLIKLIWASRAKHLDMSRCVQSPKFSWIETENLKTWDLSEASAAERRRLKGLINIIDRVLVDWAIKQSNHLYHSWWVHESASLQTQLNNTQSNQSNQFGGNTGGRQHGLKLHSRWGMCCPHALQPGTAHEEPTHELSVRYKPDVNSR